MACWNLFSPSKVGAGFSGSLAAAAAASSAKATGSAILPFDQVYARCRIEVIEYIQGSIALWGQV
jgi:hypothetical protein